MYIRSVTNIEADSFFETVICPHCKEKTKISTDNPHQLFMGFESSDRLVLTEDCNKSNEELNGWLYKYKIGDIDEYQIKNEMSQYK